ncbi:hypothetical protein BD770DRAFT_341865 [Pilaira anomala]|nr:hypothetical protein BD770DRAFT_341865 [Pilaira anomala]
MNKPSLPSIQFLLQEAPGPTIATIDTPPVVTTNKRHYGHRASRSVSSLPVDLQSLSLQAPEDRMVVQPIVHQQATATTATTTTTTTTAATTATSTEPFNGIPFPTTNTEKAPSWMIPDDRPMINFSTAANSNNSLSSPSSSSSSSSSHHRRKPPYAGHGRSVSEFTLPPLSSINNNNITPPSTTTTRRHGSSHRRTVSANTIDFMLSPSPHPSMRAQSYSPKEAISIPQQQQSPSITTTTTTTGGSQLFEQLNEQHHENPSSDTSGRYICPYCQKKFSRPSSLRIHTYSHTGEKPFVCTEPGCGRHFSVQSNMRRHLRVHRLGRGASNNNGLETTNEEE